MSPALACIKDTLRLLLEEAKEAKESVAAKRGSTDEAFEVGRSEALSEALHTWDNQLQTFGLDAQLNGVYKELGAFLTSQGYSLREDTPKGSPGSVPDLREALDSAVGIFWCNTNRGAGAGGNSLEQRMHSRGFAAGW